MRDNYYLKSSKTFLLRHCPPNPTIEFADGMVSLVPDDCEKIISQGGGSTIDVGKWIAKKKNLLHTAIPTTAGTGSEVTRYCVLTVDGKKKTFTDDKFIPESYVLDPRLVITLPEEHTVATALDALSQAYESIWSKNRTPESLEYAYLALRLIPENLVKSITNPKDEVARMNCLIGANLSGRAINITKTNVCHAISYPLTELYGIPHGIACALSLGYFAEKYLGITALKNFIKSLNLKEYAIDKEKITEIAIQSEKLGDCWGTVTKEDILASLS